MAIDEPLRGGNPERKAMREKVILPFWVDADGIEGRGPSQAPMQAPAGKTIRIQPWRLKVYSKRKSFAPDEGPPGGPDCPNRHLGR